MAKKSEDKKLLFGAIIGLVLIAVIVAGILIFQPADNGGVRLQLAPQGQTLAVGETVQLKLTDEAANGKTVQAQWRSDAPSVVTVDQQGMVTASAPGNARVTACVSTDGVEYTAVASITVSQEKIEQLSIDGAAVPNVERQFLISAKTANVTDFPMQGIVKISDEIKDTCMVFAAGKGTDLHSDAWELTGTITKEDMTKSMFMSFGVYDENGKEQWFCILDECMSLQRFWNWWDTRYEPDGSHVAVNQASSDFFFGKRADLSFKIVVKNDIFRAYFGTSPSSVKLAWELPLTDERFGGFAEGSKYELAINTVDPNNMVISGLKTVTGDAVKLDGQRMPGPSANLLSVWNGNVSFKPGTGVYTMGEGDATAMTPKSYDKVELSATFCPDVWPIQGFALKQGDNLVTFKFGSEGYDNFVIRTAINGVDGPFPATAFDFSLVGAFSYEMKMTYDGEHINFFTQRNGKWDCINMAPISLADLLGESYDPEQGVSVGIAGFNGCGRQFKNISLSNKVTTVPSVESGEPGSLSVHSGNVVYDAASGMYIMGEGDATALTGKAYRQVELSATFCPNTWPIQGFALKQGDNLVTFKFGSEGYDNFVIRTAINGVDGPFPATAFDFSLAGAFSYEMKMTYDGEYINFFTQRNGKWDCINMDPISLADLLGESYDPEQGVSVGIAGFNGCGRQFKNISLSNKVTTVPSVESGEPGPLSVHSGNVVYDAASGMYIMGEGDATAVTEKAYTEAELSVTFCPNTWPIQGFAVKQGENTVTLKFGSEGYSSGAILSKLNEEAEVSIATGFGFSLYGANNYQMKLTFDGENINLLTNQDGVWLQINRVPISVKELFGADYNASKGICVGIAGFDSCGRQFRSVAVDDKVSTQPGAAQPGNKGPLPVHSGEISYDAIPDAYFMNGGDATAVTDKAYQEVDLTATFCPDVWPIQGFAMKQGENMVTIKFGSEGYNATQVMIYKNGEMVSAPEILHEFSLYGAHSYELKLIYKNGEAWLYFMLDGVWTQLSKYPIALQDILGSEFDSTQGIAVGIAGFDGCGRQIKNVILSESVTLTPELGLWDHYGASVAELRAQEYALKGENGATTIFVGDSFMDPAFWATFISDMSGREALCLGIGGSTAEDWLGYLDEEIFLHNIQPKNMVFNLGNNDLHNDGDLNVYLENMKKLLQAVHELTPNTKLFMFSVAHRQGAGTNGMVDQANTAMQQWCEEQGWVTFVNISDQLTTDMLSDGIHPKTPYYKSIYLPTLEAAGCEFEGEIIEIESMDVLPVHNGNVTFNENTGMYIMGDGDATAMTEKVYTDAELTATFCPDTWPVQGFAVKQGSNTVTFKFGSEGFDTNHIMTAVNGTAAASNPATAFDFSLVGAYSYNLKLTYEDGNVNFHLNDNGTWKQINASPISLSTIISGFDKAQGISVGIAGFYGCGRQFSNVAVTGTEGSAEPPVATADPLPVHNGNVTYNSSNGMYVMGDGDATAMTEKVYTDAELTATFCPDTWPVQGFAVKQGSNTVTFKFGSEGFDTNHIMTAVNGTAAASNPATAFDFSLVGAYSYNLKLTYEDGNVNFHLNDNGTWQQINASPISLSTIISGFDKNQGISVGIAGFYGCGRQFSNVAVTGQEAVPGENPGEEPETNPDILTEKNNMDFLTDAGLYYATGATPYAVVADTATGFTLEADFLGNGQGWPIMGFAVKQGDNWAGFYLDTVGGNPGNYIHVFKGGAASYNDAIPISPALQMGIDSNVRLKMVYADGAFNFYIKNGEEWKLLNATPYTLEALNTVCGNIFTADGFQAGVAGFDGCTGAFSNAVYTKEQEPVADPDILTVKNNMDFLTDAGLYYATGATPYAVVADTATGFTLEADFLGNGQGWPIMGFAVKQGDNWAGFYLDTVGGNPGNYIHVFKGGAASYNDAIPISPALQMGASSNIRLKMVYADGAFNFYIKNGEEWKLLNATPYTLEALNTVCGNIFTADGFQAGVAGFDGCTGAFANIAYTKTGGATRRSPAEPIVMAVLPVSSEQEKIMSLLMHMAVSM